MKRLLMICLAAGLMLGIPTVLLAGEITVNLTEVTGVTTQGLESDHWYRLTDFPSNVSGDMWYVKASLFEPDGIHYLKFGTWDEHNYLWGGTLGPFATFYRPPCSGNEEDGPPGWKKPNWQTLEVYGGTGLQGNTICAISLSPLSSITPSDFYVYADVVVPEPATSALLGLGGLAIFRRRRG